MATTQDNYKVYGIAETDSLAPVWNDGPAQSDPAGLTNAEGGRGNSFKHGQQVGHGGETLKGLDGDTSEFKGAYDNEAETVSAGYMGVNHVMLVIVDGVSYTIVPGTATHIPTIVKAVLDDALDVHGNGIPHS